MTAAAAATEEPPAQKPETKVVKAEKTESKPESKPEKQAEKNHTIVLVQMSKHDSTRFYTDHPSLSDAIEGVLRMYETRLKELNPGAKTINYDIASLTQYVDDLVRACYGLRLCVLTVKAVAPLCCLVQGLRLLTSSPPSPFPP